MKKYSKSFLFLISTLLLTACHPKIEQARFVSSENISIANIEADTSIAKIIEPYRVAIYEEMNTVLAESAQVMENKVRPESLLGNFVADLTMAVSNRYTDEPIDFCILNTGGLRSTLPKGPITTGDIFQLLPFENILEVVTISGQKVKEAADYLVKTGGEPISGIRLSIANGEVEKLLINGKELDIEKNYRVLTSDYLANGGDNMTFFNNPVKRESLDLLLREAILKYVEEQGNKQIPLNSKIDGRISYE